MHHESIDLYAKTQQRYHDGKNRAEGGLKPLPFLLTQAMRPSVGFRSLDIDLVKQTPLIVMLHGR